MTTHDLIAAYYANTPVKLLWKDAFREVRCGHEESRNPLTGAAWELRYTRHDKLAGKLDGEVYREQQRRLAKRWVRSMVPFFKGWTS